MGIFSSIHCLSLIHILLVVGGICGVAVSTVLACKATLKVNEVLEEAKQNIDNVHKALEAVSYTHLLFGPLFESMLQGEMNSHLGYESNDKGIKQTEKDVYKGQLRVWI